MGIMRGFDGSEPIRPERIERPSDLQPERRVARAWHLGTGTIACPSCDAPVMLPRAPMGPHDALACPVCDHYGTVRDFLTVGEPTRPTRVQIRAVIRPPVPAGS
jgi:hypothetical protein